MDENIKTQSFVRWKRAWTRDETKDEKMKQVNSATPYNE